MDDSDYVGWYLGETEVNELPIGYFYHTSSINIWLALDYSANEVSEFINGNSKSVFMLFQ